MAKKTGGKKASMFYCRTRCVSCERTTKLCAWLPPKGWTCRECAMRGNRRNVLVPIRKSKAKAKRAPAKEPTSARKRLRIVR